MLTYRTLIRDKYICVQLRDLFSLFTTSRSAADGSHSTCSILCFFSWSLTLLCPCTVNTFIVSCCAQWQFKRSNFSRAEEVNGTRQLIKKGGKNNQGIFLSCYFRSTRRKKRSISYQIHPNIRDMLEGASLAASLPKVPQESAFLRSLFFFFPRVFSFKEYPINAARRHERGGWMSSKMAWKENLKNKNKMKS